MKKFISIVSIIFSMTMATLASAESLDKLVAIINDDVVTQSELTRAVAATQAQINQENLPMPTKTVLEKQVLDQLINKKLQLQIAKQSGMTASDAELDNAIKNVATQNNMSVDDLYKRINQDGMTTKEYRREMRDQIILHKIQQQEIAGKITITKEEIAAFLRSKSWVTKGNNEYRVEDILIPFSDTPSPQEIQTAKKRAGEVLAKLKSGKNFQEVAQVVSKDRYALQGGDLGWRKLPEIPTAFVNYVTKMKKDGLAGPIQTPNGFHIIHLVDLRSDAATQAPPSKKMVENFLLQQKFEEAVQNWVAKLRNQAFIVTNPQ